MVYSSLISVVFVCRLVLQSHFYEVFGSLLRDGVETVTLHRYFKNKPGIEFIVRV